LVIFKWQQLKAVWNHKKDRKKNWGEMLNKEHESNLLQNSDLLTHQSHQQDHCKISQGYLPKTSSE
jgi:hypothetical protein